MSDNEFSRDGDSPDALSRVPPSDVDSETLQKLREQVSLKKLSSYSNQNKWNCIKLFRTYLISKHYFKGT